MPYLRPIKLVSNRAQSEQDIFDIVKFISTNILSRYKPRENRIQFFGNYLVNPQAICDNPISIAEQVVNFQNRLGIETNRCARLYNVFYVFNEDFYIPEDIFWNMICDFMKTYSNFQYCSIVLDGPERAAFFIFSNYSINGIKMSAPGVFKPQRMQECYELAKKKKTEENTYEINLH